MDNITLVPKEDMSIDKRELVEIDVDKIDMSLENVRKTDVNTDVDQLAKEIASDGLMQPIEVRPKKDEKDNEQYDKDEKDIRYDVIQGQRRLLAVKKLGWKKIRAFVLTTGFPTKNDKIRSLKENVDRVDIHPMDKAEVILDLLEEYDGDWGLLSEMLNRSESTLKNWARFGEIPVGIQKMIADRKITKRDAVRLSTYSEVDSEELEKIADKIANIDGTKEKQAVLQYVRRNPKSKLSDINKVIPGMYIGMSFNAMVGKALKSACKGEEPRDFIKKLTLKYLYDNGYLVSASGVSVTPRDTRGDSNKVSEGLSEDEKRNIEKQREDLRKYISDK